MLKACVLVGLSMVSWRKGERPKCIIYEIFECGMPHSNLSYTGIPVCSGSRYNDPRL